MPICKSEMGNVSLTRNQSPVVVGLNRRQFLLAGACLALPGSGILTPHTAAAQAGPNLGNPQPFDFARLQQTMMNSPRGTIFALIGTGWLWGQVSQNGRSVTASITTTPASGKSDRQRNARKRSESGLASRSIPTQ